MKRDKKSNLRGVNLGGWLILEKWMTPSVFAGTTARDEYSFMQTPDAIEKITVHRQDFIKEDDFKWLAQNGINAVRLPIGYWVFENSGPYIKAIEFVDFAVDMCEKYNLKLLIDLHAAPGSQNGRDHSGRIGPIGWHKERLNQLRSIDVLEKLAQRYYHRQAVWGYQLLNEPKPGLIQWRLRRYYRQSYRRLIEVARPGTNLVIHDGFTAFLMSGAVRPQADFPVILDRHWYHFLQVFHKFLPLKIYFKKLQLTKFYYRVIRRTQPLIIGEWSGVLAHPAVSKLTENERKAAERRHIIEQLNLYDHETDGWFYWSYKTEKADLWNFRSLVEKQIINLKN